MSSLSFAREDRLNLARASPEAVARHDKEAWLALFASESTVEDPVGIVPFHRSPDDTLALSRFYEMFIAPNRISMTVFRDIVAGNEVIRDVDIHVKSSTGLVTSVRSYLLYTLTEEGNQTKVKRLAAHWELGSMVRQVLGRGWPGLKMMAALSWRMVKIQGLAGVWGYMKGFRGIHGTGKKAVTLFAEGTNAGDTGLMTSLFDAGNSLIEFPVGTRNYSPESFPGRMEIRLQISDVVSAGLTTAFRCNVTIPEGTYQGIGLFEFSPKTRKICRARFFWDETGKVEEEPATDRE